MISDSLTRNPISLPLENISGFQKYIQRQDESVDLFSNQYPKETQSGNFPMLRQKSFNKDSSLCISMFYQKGKSNSDFQIKARMQFGLEWMFFSLLICYIIVTILTFKNNKRIFQLFKAFFVPHFTNQLIREGNIIREFFMYPILLTYFISLSLLISTALNHFLHYNVNLSQFLLLSLFVMLFYIFKVLLVKFLGWVFQTTKETLEYLTNYMIFSFVAGVFLFPLVFFLIFSSPFISIISLYVIIIVLIIIFGYQTTRGLMIGLSSNRYSLYYLFLYLCTVEILPLCISVKLLINFYLTGYFLK
jgi:hypothetical protein